MPSIDQILKTEYSDQFDKLRKNRMIMSYYKYGAVKDNYQQRLIKGIESLEKRLDAYKRTGNTEFLADIANFAMIEFMYPQHPKAHFEATDSNKSPGIVGMSINQLKEL